MKGTKRKTTTSSMQALLIVACAGGISAVPAVGHAQDAVLEWNETAQQLVVVPSQSPVQQTRLMAIVHVAMHDAVNAISGEYERYAKACRATGGTTPEAAAIGAAYRALQGTVGDSEVLATRLADSIAAHDLAADDPGLAFGAAVADCILDLRRDDGAAAAAYPYVPPDAGAPGVWVPLDTQTALLPGWGQVAPFVLNKASQFRPGPPVLESDRYARDYAEILDVGRSTSTTRTLEQERIAQFWRASPTELWNPLLRHALTVRGGDLSSAARAMAIFYLAAADASIACWEAKYVYNFWRPQAAITRGDEDGNDETVGDPAWRPLFPTPPHPEYVSAHASNSSAMAFVLGAIFGDDPGYVIEAHSSTAPGFVREWRTFSEGVAEVIDARVYSGIHFRTSDEIGARLGRQVGRFVLEHALRPRSRR